MAKVRSIVVVSLLVLWTAAPALACLPNRQMTQAEMDCCKKMAGDCHRGSGQHPCCKTTPNVSPPLAAVQQIPQVHPGLAMLYLNQSFQAEPTAEGQVVQIRLGLPPPAPPGPNSILRI